MNKESKKLQRLAALVGDCVFRGEFKNLEKELSAMRAIAVSMAESENNDDITARLLAALVADLVVIVGFSIRFQAMEAEERE